MVNTKNKCKIFSVEFDHGEPMALIENNINNYIESEERSGWSLKERNSELTTYSSGGTPDLIIVLWMEKTR